MKADFNARKAAQVVAYFALKNRTGRINVLKAVKLVYLADRTCLKTHGYPIIDDDRVSMPHGPVNSTTYRYMGGECEDSEWSNILRDRSNHEISVKPHGPINNWDELSDAEIACLDAVWEKFGHMDQWQLRDWTHEKKNLPEWEDTNNSSASIPLLRILYMLRVENAEEQALLIEDHRDIDKLFRSLRH